MINGSYAGDQLDLLASRTSPSSVPVRVLCFLPDAGRPARPRRRREPSPQPPIHHSYALHRSHSDKVHLWCIIDDARRTTTVIYTVRIRKHQQFKKKPKASVHGMNYCHFVQKKYCHFVNKRKKKELWLRQSIRHHVRRG